MKMKNYTNARELDYMETAYASAGGGLRESAAAPFLCSPFPSKLRFTRYPLYYILFTGYWKERNLLNETLYRGHQ